MCHRINFEIRLFAQAAQIAGTPKVLLPLESFQAEREQTTIQQISDGLCQMYPQLAELIDRSRWAVETEFVSHEQVVSAGQRVALIPPVSGG